MVKTTPPGPGSRVLRLGGPDLVDDLAVGTRCGARLLATGPFADDDLGVACYHSKTGAVELYLNHLADGPGEYVVVDCTADAGSARLRMCAGVASGWWQIASTNAAVTGSGRTRV
jgi:CO dehydrogenase maturation factor